MLPYFWCFFNLLTESNNNNKQGFLIFQELFMHSFTLCYFYNIFTIAAYAHITDLNLYAECVKLLY